MRTVCWFSCGATSAVATKMILNENPDALAVRIVLDNEHVDNERFARDCERWYGRKLIELRSDKYKDCWDVWEREQWLNGPGGARCTVELKKKVRQAFQLPDDLHVFGFDNEEKDRALHFKENNLEITARFPLIERDWSKLMCLREIKAAGIELPIMYLLGYDNANCIGCPKGGRGYWNKIRIDFPDVFERMAKLERSIGASCINGVFLDELDPHAGRHEDIRLPECGLFCYSELAANET